MNFIDTHTHLFLEEFNKDRDLVIESAIAKGVNQFFLPNIDSSSIDDLINLSTKYPDNCFPMMGLHPTSVKENFEEELELVEKYLEKEKFYGVGETGIDLYWDKTFIEEQERAFRYQIKLAKKYKLPIIIHVRDSFDEVFKIVDELNDDSLTGIFHCFSGDYIQAEKIIGYKGFKLGIGGVITFKNSNLSEIISKIDLQHIVLETDAPFLSPVPKRGRRNESAYLIYIAQKIADLHNISIETVAEISTKNARQLFKI
ncbi:MAG: TatD family hydrolase [Bacteroidales bacterium]|nr:TatD family hydrolase [Bacteroidales bacterium]